MKQPWQPTTSVKDTLDTCRKQYGNKSDHSHSSLHQMQKNSGRNFEQNSRHLPKNKDFIQSRRNSPKPLTKPKCSTDQKKTPQSYAEDTKQETHYGEESDDEAQPRVSPPIETASTSTCSQDLSSLLQEGRPFCLHDAVAHRLLGYDWIAGLLDNANPLIDQPDSFYEDIANFRKLHYDDCHALITGEDDLMFSEIESHLRIRPNHVHQSIKHGPVYRINSRLFPEKMKDDFPCEDLGPDKAHYVKISIPHQLVDRQNTERFFNGEKTKNFGALHSSESCIKESICLQEHCVRGFEHVRCHIFPEQRTISLHRSNERN
eukprot:gene8844-1204_t